MDELAEYCVLCTKEKRRGRGEEAAVANILQKCKYECNQSNNGGGNFFSVHRAL
jgi:hypothetical protein